MKKVILPLLTIFTLQVGYSQARVQVIHNSADAAAEVVDIYLDDALAIDDFAFRTATEFIDFPADVEVVIGVAPPNSTGSGDAIATFPVTLADGETYVVVADGIVSPTGYDPAPAFGLQVYPMGREAATLGTNTDVLVHHGSTDAPTVDVVETGAGAGTIVDDLAYTDFQGYLELPTADYVLEIRDETGSVGVAAFGAPLGTLGLDGVALVVVASGFLNPANNSDGPAFGLWVALPSGGDLVELPGANLGVNDFNAAQFALYPNPSSDLLNLRGVDGGVYNMAVIDMQGRVIMTQENINTETSIDVSTLANGIYNVQISEGQQTVTKRFIKK
jgi:Secretion system C-terminal sorting domain/Domain of unknown function (DUF4397)